MTELIIAVGLIFVIEGMLYALFPGAMKNMMKMVLNEEDGTIRQVGLLAAVIGVIVIYVFS